MPDQLIPLEVFALCLLLNLEGVSGHPSSLRTDHLRLSKRYSTSDDSPINFSRGAKIGVIVGTIFVVSMLVLWLLVRNRGAWRETDLDHGIQPPTLEEASRRQVHLEQVSNIVPRPRESLAAGGEVQGGSTTIGGAQEDWRRNPGTDRDRDGTLRNPAPAYVLPPVPPPTYTALES